MPETNLLQIYEMDILLGRKNYPPLFKVLLAGLKSQTDLRQINREN